MLHYLIIEYNVNLYTTRNDMIINLKNSCISPHENYAHTVIMNHHQSTFLIFGWLHECWLSVQHGLSYRIHDNRC